ncbi:MAG: glutathione peroxidase [Planctomycetota bacterium]
MTENTEDLSALGVYGLGATKLDGGSIDLSHYEGKVSLIVNVASECGYTKQYAGLQKLHEDFRDEGFNVLAFPSNEFGGQEPGSSEEIRAFCDTNYSITFPMFEKIETKAGDGQSPIYGRLGEATGELPAWNFGKYLVGKDGKPLAYFASGVTPESDELRTAIQSALAN